MGSTKRDTSSRRLRAFATAAALAAILVAFAAPPAWSQATSAATITGLVTDEQNAAVVGAEVRILDMATGEGQSTMTNETGRYVLVNVTPASYTITVSKPGFTVFRIASQKVDVGTSLSINA